ncbi:Fur-regulated basic protein FbpA [Bacillus thuringiensis]|nr:Fur-regulated basic protein FbpA [Bacillus thuringiensis]MYW25020.1 Fur-regulated basic protein FbpA [Bacillus thuringiensis]MYW25099.1 Fur-regulated basic protein FbpA [Bacillus thuringiensis]
MDRQDRLIEQLIKRNIFKLTDGRDLFEGSCEELAGLLERDGENETHKE